MQQISIKEFAGRLRDSVTHNPETHVVFFLGAGCSISSGIPAAGGLVTEWLKRLRAAKGLAGVPGLADAKPVSGAKARSPRRR